MRRGLLGRVLFIVYCIEAGAVLLVMPWGHGWERMMLQLPLDALRQLALHPLGRSLVSAFGVVHLVWGLHDATQLLTQRRPREPDAS